MQKSNATDYGKTKPRATRAGITRTVHAIEPVEYALTIFLRNPYATILDSYRD